MPRRLLALFHKVGLRDEGRHTMQAWSPTMGRKAASTSTRVAQQPGREPGHTRRSTRPADRQRLARVPRSPGDQSLDRNGLGAGPKATSSPDIADNFPEFVAVLDRELDAIETYLAASLEDMFGRLD